jgi:TPR repeat protein
MIRALLILVLVSVAVWRPAHADPIEDGVAAVKKGDYDAAVRIFRPLAVAGNAAAQNEIGKLYLNGLGVSQDYAQSMAWFRKSAAQGNAPATNNVGLLFGKGWGVPADAKEAVSWYEKSAEPECQWPNTTSGICMSRVVV